VRGHLRGAEQASHLVPLWEAASGDLPPDRLLGMWFGDLRRGEEEVSDLDYRGRGCRGGSGRSWLSFCRKILGGDGKVFFVLWAFLRGVLEKAVCSRGFVVNVWWNAWQTCTKNCSSLRSKNGTRFSTLFL
jgi:hypothetical protein